jgi:hypothetical protein
LRRAILSHYLVLGANKTILYVIYFLAMSSYFLNLLFQLEFQLKGFLIEFLVSHVSPQNFTFIFGDFGLIWVLVYITYLVDSFRFVLVFVVHVLAELLH